LKVENTELTNELLEKSKHLENTNIELVKHNNELQQFSYAVSHNLRGPVASLLGLIGLFKKEDLSAENQNIFTFMDRSANHLDQIITDLSKIVDIRHSIFQIRQRISWSEEINKIILHLNRDFHQNNIQLNLQLDQCPDIFSVRPLIQSILYNLISNAVKYRNTTRPCLINITTSENDTHYFLMVKDNGLGIDLAKYKNSLFKLYKRFHLHSEGKGLGLYLVKLQVESLGGTIDVTSEVNNFTQFSVSIKKPANISRQIIFEEDYSRFFFNAPYDTCGLVWSGSISSEQYRGTMTRCLELLRVYNTPNWISDAIERGTVGPEDLDWLIQKIVPVAAKNGLRRICFVRKDADEPGTIEFVDRLQEKLPLYNIELGVFVTFQSALNWIQEKNLTDN
jgi:two-component sensor histidine kinase